VLLQIEVAAESEEFVAIVAAAIVTEYFAPAMGRR